ncbi:tyrosine-type recombinase/integrase, partial [Patescibacteria group bacterium]|nr:tyrosine-type recombinase/integrase [Patescibacteria group bacterium]
FSTGIKTSELISIKMSQMKLDEHVLQIAKEGLPEQLLPLDDRVCALLNSFIKVQRLEILLERGSDYLFPTRRGDRMTRQAFWYLFGKCSKTAGINKKVTPSAARHTFAIRLLEEGKSQEAVSKLLLLSDASAVRKIYGYAEKISKPKAGSLLALDT